MRIKASEVQFDNSVDVWPMSYWIPVSERLPEKSGSYLVTTKNGIVMVGKYDKFITAAWNGQLKNAVVAWAELPEPYKEQS